MALDNKVLDNFFNKAKKPIHITRKIEGSDTSSIANKNHHRRFRVFDEPVPNDNNGREDINLGQTKDKIRTQSKTNIGQIEDNPKTKPQNSLETWDKPKTELRTESRTNLGQLENNLTSSIGFSSLVGLQRKITLFIYENCKLNGDKVTQPIAIEHLASLCNTTELSAQKTIQRLEKKKILYRAQFKIGRSGWTKYGLPESVFQELIHNETYEKLILKLGQSSDKPKTELRTESRTMLPSSSSDIKTTTTKQSQDSNNELQLSSEWEGIEITPLEDIGFSKHHLKQIANQNKISYTETQDSINAFAFDLKNNNKAKQLKTAPLNYFMGILRNGIPYAPPSNYKSQKEIEMEQYLARKKEEKERIKKLEDEIINHEFEEWLQTISEIERNEIVGELQQSHMYTDKVKESVAKSRLFDYFKKNINLTIEKS